MNKIIILSFFCLFDYLSLRDIKEQKYYYSGGLPQKYVLLSIEKDVITLESYFKWQGQFLVLKKDTSLISNFNKIGIKSNIDLKTLKGSKVKLKIRNSRLGNLTFTLTTIDSIPTEFLEIRKNIDKEENK
jgi:hypothetical protein